MNYIVIDLEFNQPFNFVDNTKGVSNPKIPFEIIQIGAVKLDEDFKKINSINLLIKPTVYKRLHPFVKKITGFSSKDFSDSLSFTEAFLSFVKFCGDDESILCVWGDNDIKLLFKNALFYKLDVKVLPHKFINVQQIAGKFLKEPDGKLIGLKNAITLLDIPMDDPFHNAFFDAVYTSLVLKKLKDTPIKINTFKVAPTKKKAHNNKTFKTDLLTLYEDVSKEYGRKLTRKDKKVIKMIYDAGLKKIYETL